ncbi:MAG: fumarylacetoacetate hydrolase family protein [Sphingobacteriia bacterium]
MRLAHLHLDNRPQMVWVGDERCVPAAYVAQAEGVALPETIDALVADLPRWEEAVRNYYGKWMAGSYAEYALPWKPLAALSPILRPRSCRDAYAFRQHVETSRRNRNVPMIPEFDQFPVFDFTNPQTVVGAGELHFMPRHFEQLDYELEVAIVLGKGGRNLHASEADACIFGLCTMNDWSARALQMEEMKLNLGPAKGKDFATGLGPMLVTVDELAGQEVPAHHGHTGKTWNLQMTASINGKRMSEGNLSDMNWTFAEILERISYGVDVYPAEVIGSGTAGTGCLLELNGTARLANPAHTPQWLQPGDRMEVCVQQLGCLHNTLHLAS